MVAVDDSNVCNSTKHHGRKGNRRETEEAAGTGKRRAGRRGRTRRKEGEDEEGEDEQEEEEEEEEE